MTNPIDLIEQACIEITGAAPARHLILSKVGHWLRFASSTDKKGRTSCGLILHDHGDYFVGCVVDHKSGVSKNFHTRTGKRALMTPEERAAAQRQRQEYERRRAEKSARKHRMLAPAARRIWAGCLRPEHWDKPHPYIEKKQTQPHNIRRYISANKDVLILPMIDPFSGIKSLYLIDRNGFKRPLKGSQTAGLCMAIGTNLNTASRIWLVEGWATGSSLHEVTGDSVVVAFTAGNLAAVAEKILIKYPDAELKLCADDDRATAKKTGKNPGIEYAKQVQQRHPQIALYKPLFPPGAPQGLSDVNDLVLYENRSKGVSHG